MEMDPSETIEQIKERNEDTAENKRRQLNNCVAVTIALLATFMGICKVKDDNIVQAMQQAQADRLDLWGWYQARHVRREVLKATADEIRLLALAAPADGRAPYDALVEKYEQAQKDLTAKMEDGQTKANGKQEEYDKYNFRDDQFDLMDAALAIAIAMLAVTSLTESVWLYWLALIPSAFGVVMGLAGLLGWGLHPNVLASWLGT